MTGRQLQAARDLIGWSQAKVADSAGVSVPTVKRAEGSGQVTASADAITKIRSALEAQGIQFLDSGEVAAGPGVALKRDQ
ncbi:helix-turn-helix domain-containing protein [Ruegeria jejuensis]|uniref:helix-turn-helix domain-containing protein n=1 Tax=Ruegeria jejuensis TaxID=3233338 RepID=UPI00355AE2ED